MLSTLFYGLRNQKEFLFYANKQKITIDEQIELLKKLPEKEAVLKSYLKLADGYHDMIMFSIINRGENND